MQQRASAHRGERMTTALSASHGQSDFSKVSCVILCGPCVRANCMSVDRAARAEAPCRASHVALYFFDRHTDSGSARLVLDDAPSSLLYGAPTRVWRI